MKITIRRIAPVSLAAILGAINFTVGCVWSLFILVSGFLGLTLTMKGPIAWNLPLKPTVVQAVAIAVVYPFGCAIAGIITGFILAWLYNFVSRFLDGLMIETDDGLRHEN